MHVYIHMHAYSHGYVSVCVCIYVYGRLLFVCLDESRHFPSSTPPSPPLLRPCHLLHYNTIVGWVIFVLMQRTVILCNSLQRTADHCSTLQHTATHCNNCNTRQQTATHCSSLQHTAAHCNALQHMCVHRGNTTRESSQQNCATHCNTMCCNVLHSCNSLHLTHVFFRLCVYLREKIRAMAALRTKDPTTKARLVIIGR